MVDFRETNMNSYFDTAARVEEFGAVGLNLRFVSGDFFVCVYFLLVPRHATQARALCLAGESGLSIFSALEAFQLSYLIF